MDDFTFLPKILPIFLKKNIGSLIGSLFLVICAY
nr:MAG TPA: Pardaxin [Caudoviricetes sp.]